ncbi:hypothetical protein [Parapedobacter tibetensis]|uniref:hypothetical protein n=1 Tax=Parapedobacter tibetensis TaxID=2972951 RepID=UPI00214D29D4|nr:hypothetical protein [Parapedobacter tibetensis]
MNNNYNIIRIQQYLNNELSEAEMYQLERDALNDPLLHDAMEGYRQQKEVSHRQLSLLQQRLANRIAGQAKERNSFYFGWQRLGVAATACVLMVLVLVLLWMRNHSVQQTGEKEVQVELATPGSGAGIHATGVNNAEMNAYPEGGWDTFNEYLTKNKGTELPAGEVILTFPINSRGRPVAIEGSDGTDPRLLEEAKRLLQAGPIWKGQKGKIQLVFQ